MKGMCMDKEMASTRFLRRALGYHKEGREVWENPVKDGWMSFIETGTGYSL